MILGPGVQHYMQHSIATITLAVAVLFGHLISLHYNLKDNQLQKGRGSIERSEKRPDLSVQYTDTAKLKLASRKTTYRLGEMISLDLALLNIARSPVFFHRLLQPNFHVTSRRKVSVGVVPYLIIEPVPDADLYTLLQPGEITTKSFEVLAGCETQALENLSKGLDKSAKELFEQDQFVNWGEFCLRVDRPGTYTIIVEQLNSDVVIAGNDASSIRTAIGEIRSTPLNIEIIR